MVIFTAMKQFSAIVVLAALLGTMYGYVLGKLEFKPKQVPQSPFPLASEYPSYLLEGNIWGQIIFWSALPLFLLFAWLTMKYVSRTLIRDEKARLQEKTIAEMNKLFEEVSPLMRQAFPDKGNST